MGDGSVSINMGQPQWPPMAIEESFKGKQWKVNVLYWESQSTIFLSGFPCFKNGQSRQNGRGTVVVGVAATCKSSEVPPESWAGGDLLVIRALNLLESGSTFLTFPICEVILWLTTSNTLPMHGTVAFCLGWVSAGAERVSERTKCGVERLQATLHGFHPANSATGALSATTSEVH